MLRTTLFLAVALAGSIPVAAQTTAPPDPLAGARAAFELALSAVPGGEPAYEDSDLLRSYPLYPWLEAERLEFALSRADRNGVEPPDGAIAAFLTRDGDAPWTRDLRAAWLKTLAARQRWPEFLGFYLEARADTALR